METRQLKYFLDVANCLNFTKAAAQNHISQTAMSQNISSLEDQLGFKLFVRNKRNVTLSYLGEAFYHEAIKIIRCAEMAERHMKKISEGSEGIIKIGFQGEHESHFLPKVVRSFRTAYPNVNLEFVQGISASLEKMLETGEVDIIFNLQYQDKAEDTVELFLESQPMCLVVPSGHPLAQNTTVARSVLSKEPMVFFDPSCGESIYDYMIHDSLRNGFSPNIVGYATTIFALLLMVACHIGLTVLPKTCDVGNKDILFVPLDGEAPVNMMARWKKENENTCLPFFLEELKKWFCTATN